MNDGAIKVKMFGEEGRYIGKLDKKMQATGDGAFVTDSGKFVYEGWFFENLCEGICEKTETTPEGANVWIGEMEKGKW